MSQALEVIRRLPVYGRREPMGVDAAIGRVLASDARAAVSHPAFDSAAMDGYAVLAKDLAGASPEHHERLRLIGDVAAGRAPKESVRSGKCLSISTGAMLPRGADAVVEKELSRRDGDRVAFFTSPAPGRHVRRRGESFCRGDVLLPQGTLLSAFHLGLLHQGGVQKVFVHAPPKVALVASGDEIALAGKKLGAGKVYDTSPALLALLQKEGVRVEINLHVRDDPSRLMEVLRRALACDVVVTVGGVSAGDHDLVRGALEALRAKQVFFKVNQKPGKPLHVATRGRTTVFSLPGNPLSAIVCYWVYVRPYLQRWMHRQPAPRWQLRRLSAPYERKGERAHLLLARLSRKGQVQLIPRQMSHSLLPLGSATTLALFSTKRRHFPQGMPIPTLSLNSG